VKVVLFGATGMIGQGVLRECLLDPDVDAVLSIGRSATSQTHTKLREVVLPDLFNCASIEADLRGYDACFFCLGGSSAGMSEANYRRVTYDLTLSIAHILVRESPTMTFIFVSGASTDGTGAGRIMWARVKGQTENALMQLPFKAAVMFRPGAIVPLHGITSRTPLYRTLYALTRPFWPILRASFPRHITTTEELGRAMLMVAKRGAPKAVLESVDITALR
jgi:uncharacterized protein YbjT (DUF2867 family)